MKAVRRRLLATTLLGYIPVRIYDVPNLNRKYAASGRFRLENGNAIIELEPEQDEAMKYDTLLHELIHAADALWDLHLSEHRVRELATSLCQALRGLKKPR